MRNLQRLVTGMILGSVVFYPSYLSAFGAPALKDPYFVVEKYISGLSSPTTMEFIGDDLLVLQKNDGKVRLVRNGVLLEEPVLDLNVSNDGERGLLGITAVNSTVYLYFTESTQDGGKPAHVYESGQGGSGSAENEEVVPLGNRIYRYRWDGNTLLNPELVVDLPAPHAFHVGGALTKTLDGSVYGVIGDQNRQGLSQNKKGDTIDGTSVILRLDMEMSGLTPQTFPTENYFAIGIRNSFGLAVDPVTGNLWETENGPKDFDEINLVLPRFNSGWNPTMGPITDPNLIQRLTRHGFTYSNPEFSWQEVVAVTGLSFVNSELFDKYTNYIFVGDFIYGNLYKFELNSTRTGFVLHDPNLVDLVVNSGESMEEIIFGTGFGGITDIEFGSDGLMYVLSVKDGAIYRIAPIIRNPLSATVTNAAPSVTYGISGGKLLEMEADEKTKSLVISIDTTSNGELVITLPRTLIDAKANGIDGNFVILADGERVSYGEITTSTDRTLTVSFSKGTKEIEIIGTEIIPEFGHIALLVLTLGIFSVILIVKRRLVKLSLSVY